VTGPTGRRRWPEHVKAAIVLETYRDGVSVADIARRHDISPPQFSALFEGIDWRAVRTERRRRPRLAG